MHSVKKTIAIILVISALTSSLCACGNKSQESESDNSVTEPSTEVVEQTTVATTETTSPEDLGATPMENFVYTVMTKNNYEKYGEDALGKIIILNYTGEDSHVKIPSSCDGVEIIAIGENAFENTDVTEVELPSSIRIIEDYAFSKCTKLTKINDIDNLEVLGRCVFDETQWLKNKQAGIVDEEQSESETTTTTKAETTTTKEETTKEKTEDTTEKEKTDEGIKNTTQGIVVYSGWLIDGSTSSGDINLVNNTEIKAIAKDAFRINTGIKSVDLSGSSIKFIDDYAFSESSLAVINLPTCLERFGESVFNKCSALENIDLSDTGVTELSVNLFNDSAIKKISFPKIIENSTEDTSEKETNKNKVSETSEAKTTEAKTSETTDSQVTENTTEADGTEQPIKEPDVISEGITVIGYGAFNNCKNLTDIDLGTKLVTISDYAFAGTGLKKIVLPDSLETIGMRAFSNCTNLESVTFGKTIQSVGDEAFVKCEKLLKLTIPKSMQSIGKKAFGYTYTTNEKDLKKIDGVKIDCLKGSAIEKYCMNSDIEYNIIASTQS